MRSGDAEVRAVILINLLPHREEKRKRRKVAFFVGLGVSAAAGLAVVGGWYGFVEHLTTAQRGRNEFLSAEIRKLEVQIKDIASLKAEIDSLIARQKAVEDLQADRNLPVHLLNELVKQTPEGIYFVSVKQDGRVLSVNGIAQTQERISEFLRNTANSSEWFVRPELVESKAANVVTANKEQKRLFDFTLRLNVKRPQDTPAAAAAPGAPASAAAQKKA
jgi:type IV pilus assembly protein PilN